MVLTLISLQQDAYKLRCYSSDQIPAIWDQARPFIKTALDHGSDYTLDDIYEGLCAKQMQLWMYDDAALVTSLQTDARNKFCLLVTLGGQRMSDWFQYLPIVEAWAKDQGAKEMRLYGRIGWAKLTGYEVQWTKMSKQL